MKTYLIPFITGGLSVAFDDVTYSRDAFGTLTVHGFVVTIGGMLTLGANALYEAHESIYSDVAGFAREEAERISVAARYLSPR